MREAQDGGEEEGNGYRGWETHFDDGGWVHCVSDMGRGPERKTEECVKERKISPLIDRVSAV